MLFYNLQSFINLVRAYFSTFGKKTVLDPFATSSHSFRVWPFHSDDFINMQAGQYFTFTDCVRWHLAARIGFFKVMFKRGWYAMAGGQHVVYRRPIAHFRKFELSFRLAGYDDDWLYVVHAFLVKGQPHCVILTKLACVSFKGKRGRVKSSEVMATLGHPAQMLPPAWVLACFENDKITAENVFNFLK